MCLACGFTNIDKEHEPESPFNEYDSTSFINDIWLGVITVDNLPKSMYLKTAGYLNDGVNKGVKLAIDYNVPDELMLADLTENIYIFSGAKTYQSVRLTTDLLKQNKSSFYKFKKEAQVLFEDMNVAYLQAEYQTALASSRMAGEWQRIIKDSDVLPLLEYDTVGDSRVRPTHKALDKIVRPVNDKFWDSYYPPNGWRCRCSVNQLSEGEVTNLQGWLKPNDVPKEFMMNSGKDKIIFKTKGKGKHPYFDVAKGDKELAKKNFNLPIPNGK